MFHLTSYVFSPYLLPPLVVGVLVGILGVYGFMFERRSPTSAVFFGMTSLLMFWLLSYVGVYGSVNSAVALQWVRVEMVIVALIPTAVYVFSLSLVRRLDRFRAFAWVSLGLAVFFILSVVMTENFVSGVQKYPWGYYPKFGPLGPAFLVYLFLVLVVSLEILWSEYRRSPSPRRKKRMQWLILAFITGYFAVVDFLAVYGLAVYPFGYLPVLGFLVIAALTIKHYRLVDITPAFAAEQIVDTMNDALVVLDAEGLTQFMNRTASGCFGQGEGRFAAILDRLRCGEILRDHEEVFADPAGVFRTFSFSASVMTDDGKKPLAYVLVAHDVTDRNESDRVLMEKSLELERSRAELGQLELFSFVASHDLQEPLRKIATFSGRLRTEAKDTLTEKGREYLERMEAAVERMSRYLSDIVEFSRVAAKIDAFEPVHLDLVMQEVLADLELSVSELSADVQIKALPVIQGDRFQMRQLFQNLIANALKFRRAGERPVVCIGGEGVHDGLVRISVQDNGIGFDEKYTEKIFAPFERLHGRDEYEGSGMGLAICRRIVTRHGGRIQVRSAPGHGALFLVDLPGAV